ncbi:MAG: nucleotide sugar dehydrogenase [Candidatus Sumerlaeaceae bacterium]
MKIAIFGLGYVGTVCSACFAAVGHEVLGVDVSQVKVDLINGGRSPIVEPGLDEAMAEGAKAGRLRATSSAEEAVAWADICLVCVGTPARENGALNLEHIYDVCAQIGKALRKRASDAQMLVVTIRSTVLPGTLDECQRILERESGAGAGARFAVACNPEFLREGSALKDFRDPPYTLVGTDSDEAAARLRELYAHLRAPFHHAPVSVAEMIKYVNNSYHALKVAFANEVGSLCKALGIDSHRVMELFCADTKLNISPAYFRPGFAFGGSCLPKDLSAINHKARSLDVSVPVLAGILPSNRAQLQHGYRLISGLGKKKVGLLGLSFKAGTDDLRESPLVELVEQLIGKGYEVRIYDRNVNLARLVGANKAYIEQQIPHVSQLFVQSMAELLDYAECVVIGNNDPEFASVLERARADQHIVDFVRVDLNRTSSGNYHGICW